MLNGVSAMFVQMHLYRAEVSDVTVYGGGETVESTAFLDRYFYTCKPSETSPRYSKISFESIKYASFRRVI